MNLNELQRCVILGGVQYVIETRNNRLNPTKASVIYRHQWYSLASGWTDEYLETVRPDQQTSQELAKRVVDESDQWRTNYPPNSNIVVFTPRFIEVVEG